MSIRIGASRIGPRVENACARRGRLPLPRLAGLLVAVACNCVLSAPLQAQTQSQHDAQKAAVKQANGRADMLVEANEMVYDKDKNTVSAVGNAKVYYQGKVLEADKVTYYREKKQVLAEGNAKLTDEQGNVYYGTTFELTDDFKNGFINSLLVETKDKTRFSGPRAERAQGETTTFENGTYTACEPCKDDPNKPPLWQVRAKRIIDNHVEHKSITRMPGSSFTAGPSPTPHISRRPIRACGVPPAFSRPISTAATMSDTVSAFPISGLSRPTTM